MQWVTGAHAHADRIARSWLIRRFIDPAAEIVDIARDRVWAHAERTGANHVWAPRRVAE